MRDRSRRLSCRRQQAAGIGPHEPRRLHRGLVYQTVPFVIDVRVSRRLLDLHGEGLRLTSTGKYQVSASSSKVVDTLSSSPLVKMHVAATRCSTAFPLTIGVPVVDRHRPETTSRGTSKSDDASVSPCATSGNDEAGARTTAPRRQRARVSAAETPARRAERQRGATEEKLSAL